MNKWAYLSVAAAAVIIGCGGSGSSHSTTTTTGATTAGGTTTGIVPTIGQTNAQGQTYGIANFTYLTGQGRAPGDLTAVINHVQLTDQYNTVSEALGAEASLPLSSTTAQQLQLDVPFTTQNSRLFESYTLEFASFNIEGSGSANPPPAETFPSRIRVLPGRQAEVPIYLDNSMFMQDANNLNQIDYTTYTTSPPPFPENTVFAFRNLDTAFATASGTGAGQYGEIPSYIGDYVGFNVSAMATTARPQLVGGPLAGAYATEIFVSGDNFAVTAPTASGGNSGSIQVLTQNSSQPIVGLYGPQNTVGGMPATGTYDLTQTNPNLTQLTPIVSVYGAWREYTSVMSGVGTFEMITFPTSNDNNLQELVMIHRTGGTIDNMYFGTVDFNAGLFQAFPIADIVSASASGEIDGTVGSYRGKTGGSVSASSPDSIRYGTYKIPSTSPITNTSQALPSGFQSAGTFAVFRV